MSTAAPALVVVLSSLVAGCGGSLRHRILVGGRAAFAPDSPRAARYSVPAPSYHRGVERDIVRSLQRVSAVPLRPDGQLRTLGETLFDEIGEDLAGPSPEIVEFAARWHGITEMDVSHWVFESWSDSSLVEYVVQKMRDTFASMPETHMRPNRLAVVVRSARRASGGWGQRALVLWTARYCVFEPFPQRVAVEAGLRLRGRLIDPFVHPVVVITRANGQVETRPVGVTRRIDVELPTDEPGALQVEVVGSFPHGPKPLANFPVWVGRAPPAWVILPEGPGRSTASEVSLDLIRLINEERARHGLGRLAIEPVLGRIALEYSQEMHAHHFFGHVSPRSGTAQDRVERAGYRGFAGENIAGGMRSARETHEGLMSSPGHAANILDPRATQIGVGALGYGRPDARRYLVTELFGAVSSWAYWSQQERATRLGEAAATELRAAWPALDPARLGERSAAPQSRPLSGRRAVGALIALALVELSASRLDRAEAILDLAHAPLDAAPIRLEIARRRASDPSAAEGAVSGILRQLPPAHMERPLLLARRFPTTRDLQRTLHATELSEPTIEPLRQAMEIAVLWRPMIEHRDVYEAAAARVRAENEQAFAARRHRFPALDLTGASDASEVVVGIWSRAVRGESFPGRLFSNPGETANGVDDDGNGQIDDLHGVVATSEGRNTDLFGDPGRESLPRFASDLPGLMDLGCELWTPEARRVWQRDRAAHGIDRAALDRAEDDVAGWALGTHAASILLDRNPFARLAVFRSGWRRSVTDAQLVVARRLVEGIADFVRRHRVRVVLSGSVVSLDGLSSELRRGDDQSLSEGAVQARARTLLARARDDWRWLLAQCPGTLFVVPWRLGATADQDADVPAGLEAPNLLTVGDVDDLGTPGVCTGGDGQGPRLLDLAIGIPGLLPSGARVPLSGTSRAAARVAGLAGKLFALDPNGTPASVIAALVETADTATPPFAGRIPNAERAASRIRSARPAPGP